MLSSSSSSGELRNVDDDDNIFNGRDELKGGGEVMEVQVRGPLGSLKESECVGLGERSEEREATDRIQVPIIDNRQCMTSCL